MEAGFCVHSGLIQQRPPAKEWVTEPLGPAGAGGVGLAVVAVAVRLPVESVAAGR